MHSRCCSELYYVNNITIPASTRWTFDVDNIDDVPVLIEVMFDIDSPVVGDIMVANKIWTGQGFKTGNIQVGITDTQMNLNDTNLVSPGFVLEFQQGIGRGIVLINNSNQLVSDCFVSIRKLVDIVENIQKTQGNQYG